MGTTWSTECRRESVVFLVFLLQIRRLFLETLRLKRCRHAIASLAKLLVRIESERSPILAQSISSTP